MSYCHSFLLEGYHLLYYLMENQVLTKSSAHLVIYFLANLELVRAATIMLSSGICLAHCFFVYSFPEIYS
jgi:hypothetical protein